jgi:cation transport ATPase
MEESKKEFEKENSKEESETNLADATKKSSLDLIKKTFGKSYHKMRTTTILQEKVEINVETDPKDKEPKQIEMEDDSDEEEEVSQTFLDSKKILFSLFFPKDERIIEFYHDLEKNTNFNFRMILVMYSLVYFVHALILIRIKDFYPNYETLVGLRIVSAGLIASFHFLKKNLYSNNLAKLALFIVILFSFWISFYQGISYTSDLSFLQTFQLIEMSLTFTVVVYFP